MAKSKKLALCQIKPATIAFTALSKQLKASSRCEHPLRLCNHNEKEPIRWVFFKMQSTVS